MININNPQYFYSEILIILALNSIISRREVGPGDQDLRSRKAKEHMIIKRGQDIDRGNYRTKIRSNLHHNVKYVLKQ